MPSSVLHDEHWKSDLMVIVQLRKNTKDAPLYF